MKCMLCAGEMEKKNVPYSVDRKGYHLYLREVPAYVRSQCGENYFTEWSIKHDTLKIDISYDPAK